ncbi:/ sdh_2 / Serine 3-dehydrogenase /:234157 Reverse [Candidatus Hepatoplasma crinochetorum]|uniref:/ sdh_2 / Serine 3-dehydrogenase /:234157 Reverse n=1 Tax=Candidatus Hepatoplasma crinochetorum TaxID=295596 RepID=A0A0G7ZNK7_9MOLU|nr:/ sdh_2 / Serine 3-dehydrogenase /:234157 Reverse [Candidatus Hepatoplasma crinochetorum]
MKKYVLITGASSGIGKAIAKKFASEKYNLIIAARRKELLENLKKELEEKFKIEILIYVYDLSISENVYKFYSEVKNKNICLLINNAGFGDLTQPWKADSKKLEKMIDLNIKALTILTTLFMNDNFDNDKQIINVSSLAGYIGWGKEPTYSASKFYVSIFTEAIAKSLKKSKKKLQIKVLAPASTDTEFIERSLEKIDIKKEEKDKIIKKLKKQQKSPDKIAEYAFKLYNSKKTIGIVYPILNKFFLRKKIHNIFSPWKEK